jgi:hypothetical protein
VIIKKDYLLGNILPPDIVHVEKWGDPIIISGTASLLSKLNPFNFAFIPHILTSIKDAFFPYELSVVSYYV